MRYGLVLFLLIAVPCWTQTATTGKAETSGFCSPAVSGSNNQFTITCQNIPKKLRAQLFDLMNRIAKNQADAQVVMEKLDSCLEGVKAMKEQQMPWRITEAQKKEIKRQLQGMKAITNVHVIGTDRNAALFGGDLVVLLREAGWDARDGYRTDFTLSSELVGVAIVITHEDFPEAYRLSNALIGQGIAAPIVIDTKKVRMTDDQLIYIAIGAKPSTH
jgi:hypothetical protein